MMKISRSSTRNHKMNDDGFTPMIEYVSITGILMLLTVIIIFATNAALIEGPSNTLKYHHYVDIGNGVSTRIVDLYAIAPTNGVITTSFDLPNDVAGQDYFVELSGYRQYQRILVTDGNRVHTAIDIAGIGATKGAIGGTTAKGENIIIYDSGGVT
jgi:hypothetical protein